MTIQLPDRLVQFLEAQAAREGFTDSAAYLTALLDAEEKRIAKAELEAKLIEGTRGTPIRADDEYWRRKEATLVERHRKAHQ